MRCIRFLPEDWTGGTRPGDHFTAGSHRQAPLDESPVATGSSDLASTPSVAQASGLADVPVDVGNTSATEGQPPPSQQDSIFWRQS
jgi:hypothetical protein